MAVDSTVRDIKRRLDDLKAAEEMGESEGEHTHAFALDETPGLEQIRAAAQKLHDPEKRIVDEFFWFWPFEWGQGYKDPALAPLRNGHQQSAFAAWTAAEAG